MFSAFKLTRVPPDQRLQAWNAADEILQQRLSEQKNGALLIINEPFGAQMVALAQSKPDYLNDSAMSLEAIQKNLLANQLTETNPVDASNLAAQYDTVILYPPKSLNYFALLLERAQKALANGGQLLIPAMIKHLAKGHIDAMNNAFSEVVPGHAQKKARVIRLSRPKAGSFSNTTEYPIETTEQRLKNYPGCYSANSLDQGARVFMQHFDQLKITGHVLDMGCGNGVLSLALLNRNADISLCLVDENRQALASAKDNLETYYPTANVQFYHSNGMNSVPTQSFDLIVCNPPFHQENTVTEGISKKLFTDLAECLSMKGECWIIANRHLDYKKKLLKTFKHVHITSKDAKFLLYRCRNG